MYVHATHTVHAVPDLRVAGGRWGETVCRFELIEMAAIRVRLALGRMPKQAFHAG